ncbi:YqjD family protein [Halomonas sp. HMF6819]|uniref:YqjD family protein n=1 Tax=Halomonas sp. HMF6819 TaxID=3373085 RepID=UPI0037A86CFD
MAKRNSDSSARADQLKNDLRYLSETVEELVSATSKDASGEMRGLRERAERRLKETRSRLESAGEHLYEDTRESLTNQVDCCDRYVRENPWTSMGIGAAAGLVAGLLLGRR